MAKPRVVQLSDRLHHPKYAGELVSAVADKDPEYLAWMHNQGFLNLSHSALRMVQRRVAVLRMAQLEFTERRRFYVHDFGKNAVAPWFVSETTNVVITTRL